MKIYLVGGAVRDKQLGLPIHDRDWVVVGATPESMLDNGFKSVGKDFPVFLHPKTHEEYALARQERKIGKGYHGFEMSTSPDITLEDDLLRRDLTINALAEDENGDLIDPYNGLGDLHNRILRHVSDAFQEDPVRVLRLARFYARFYAYGFTIAEETKALVVLMIEQGELNHLTAERIWLEMIKGLSGDYPDQFIRALRDLGALKIILPEVDALFGIPQSPLHHPEIDCGLHTLLVLQQAAKLNADMPTRFACLCHDLGKATTPTDVLPKHIGHEHRSAILTKSLADRLKVPSEYKALAIKVARYHLLFHQLKILRAQTVLDLLLALDVIRKPHILDQFNLACIADKRGRLGFEHTVMPQADFLSECLNSVKSIDIRGLIAENSNKKVDEIVYQARLSALKNLINNYAWA